MRAAEWDERYAERRQWSAGANALIASLLEDLPPGDAVDLAAGEGRHALWLAARGWRVIAVDFSAVGLARGRSQPGAGSPGSRPTSCPGTRPRRRSTWSSSRTCTCP